MAHAFDTGLAAPFRTLIQNGSVALLSRLLRPTGYLANVAKFGAVVRSWTDVDGIALLMEAMTSFPGIGIAVGDLSSSPAGGAGFIWKEELELLVYFASNHAGSLNMGRQSIDTVAAANNAKDPGLHVMMAHAKELLVGQRCGLATTHPTVKQIRPDREEELTTRPDLTLWLQTYKVTLSTKIDPNRDLETMLLDFMSTVNTTNDDETETDTITVSTDGFVTTP